LTPARLFGSSGRNLLFERENVSSESRTAFKWRSFARVKGSLRRFPPARSFARVKGSLRRFPPESLSTGVKGNLRRFPLEGPLRMQSGFPTRRAIHRYRCPAGVRGVLKVEGFFGSTR
jgi:hypothetical protein